MANAGPAASDALYKYVECLQLHANKMKKTLSWEESQSGPPHDTLFKSSAKLDNTIYPEAQGKTKKKARQNAAKNACDVLNILTALSELSFDSTSRTPSPAGMENYISKLNEYGQKNNLLIQYDYKHIDTGMDHIQEFSSHVIIGNKTYPDGFGGSKQEAKREAARLAYEEIQEHSLPFKNLEKSPLDVRNEEDPKGDAEGSLAQNPKRLAGDQTTSEKEISDLSSSADVAGNSIDFSSTMSCSGSKNIIGELNEFCQRSKLHLDFKQVDKRGPSHVPEFTVRCVISRKEFPCATGKTKQEAKQKAAHLALEELLKNSGDLSWASSSSLGGNLSRGSDKSTSDCFSSEPSTPSMMSTSGFKSRRRLAPTWTGATAPFQDSGKGENLRMSFNEFTDIEEIGSGAFGYVYKAKYAVDEKYYAIKKIVVQDGKAKREVTLLAEMDHPCIVRYHTSWYEERDNKKYLYIQMKLYEKNLKDWIEEYQNDQPLQKEISLDIMHQLLDGVEYIHQKKMVHRDLKPANIFLIKGAKLEAKIGDFGLVTVNNQDLLTRNVGTPGYMSPEQLEGDHYDHKVDIFALGLILFELLWMLKGTVSEKIHEWKTIRRGIFPANFDEEHATESTLIREMLSVAASDRPEAAEVKQKLDPSHEQTI